MPVPAEMVVAQIDAVVSDIGVDAVKIGMIGSAETAHAVADRLEQIAVPIVFDPVMVATSGSVLADDATIAAFGRLMRLAAIITPNLPELEALTDLPVGTEKERLVAARTLARANGCAVLAKGGHGEGGIIIDLLATADGEVQRWADARIDGIHAHGTGCTVASGIATGLGEGRSMIEAVDRARAYVRAALEAAPGFGSGHGPIGHALGVVPFEHIHRKEK